MATDPSQATKDIQSYARPSICLRLIRHAESKNNEVYRTARALFRGGTDDFDAQGWNGYVDQHRSPDPTLSATGFEQANKLADYMVPHLQNQASAPTQVITSPMKRTLETIRPTIQRLHQGKKDSCHVLVNGFYFESEGCHTKDKPEDGMSPSEIRQVLRQDGEFASSDLGVDFVGFPDMERGWWCQGTGPETRVQSENRAAKFYMWLCEHLDMQLSKKEEEDLFDAGVAVPGEEQEDEHDKHAPRIRPRRVVLLIGHGDFMSLLLKRIVAGHGHQVEHEGIPHRCSFTHFNTGTTEMEYFGQGRFLVSSHNQTPHFSQDEHSKLRSGGSLKDGWSYLVPCDSIIAREKIDICESSLEPHVTEQVQAIRALYSLTNDESDNEESKVKCTDEEHVTHYVAKRGLQVVGIATFSHTTGWLSGVAARPSAGDGVFETLINSVRDHTEQLEGSLPLKIVPRSDVHRKELARNGFIDEGISGVLVHKR